MPLHPTWPNLAMRLVLALIAAAVLGFDREARGHVAGLRTTVLVGLAAAVAMIQANLLLSVDGKGSASFGTLDLMRLPLGILTGVGFIGGGTILKKGGSVTGVTTAATLWIVTAISLCFSGGQIGVGLAATALGWVVLWGVKRVEVRVPRRQEAALTLVTDAVSPPPSLAPLIAPLGYDARFVRREADASEARWSYVLRWRRAASEPGGLGLIDALGGAYTIRTLSMRPDGED